MNFSFYINACRIANKVSDTSSGLQSLSSQVGRCLEEGQGCQRPGDAWAWGGAVVTPSRLIVVVHIAADAAVDIREHL